MPGKCVGVHWCVHWGHTPLGVQNLKWNRQGVPRAVGPCPLSSGGGPLVDSAVAKILRLEEPHPDVISLVGWNSVVPLPPAFL
jgi:hypothetical protein